MTQLYAWLSIELTQLSLSLRMSPNRFILVWNLGFHRFAGSQRDPDDRWSQTRTVTTSASWMGVYQNRKSEKKENGAQSKIEGGGDAAAEKHQKQKKHNREEKCWLDIRRIQLICCSTASCHVRRNVLIHFMMFGCVVPGRNWFANENQKHQKALILI